MRKKYPPAEGWIFCIIGILICILDYVVGVAVSATTADDEYQDYERATVASAVSAEETVVAGSSFIVATATAQE